MVLTKATVDMLGTDVTSVQVGYNPKTRAVGIRAAETDGPGSYLLRQQGKSVSRLVDGKRVFAHHGLKVEKAASYDARGLRRRSRRRDSQHRASPLRRKRRRSEPGKTDPMRSGASPPPIRLPYSRSKIWR